MWVLFFVDFHLCILYTNSVYGICIFVQKVDM